MFEIKKKESMTLTQLQLKTICLHLCEKQDVMVDLSQALLNLIVKYAFVGLKSKLLSSEETENLMTRLSTFDFFKNKSFIFKTIFQRSKHGSEHSFL